MSAEELTSVAANRLPDGRVHVQISTLLGGALVDVALPPDIALLLTKLLVNALAGRSTDDLPPDQLV